MFFTRRCYSKWTGTVLFWSYTRGSLRLWVRLPLNLKRYDDDAKMVRVLQARLLKVDT